MPQMIFSTPQKRQIFIYTVLIFICILLVNFVIAQQSESDLTLFDKYINANGGFGKISFDASNIKLFWVNNSVSTNKNKIDISLNKTGDLLHESELFIIKLSNVDESQDCRIDILAEDNDIAFCVLNSKSKKISSSSEESFIQNKHLTSSFHLEDTYDFSFYLRFSSKTSSHIVIKKIFLSFNENKNSSFLSSPGQFCFSKDDIFVTNSAVIGDNAFTVTGKQSRTFTKKNILTSNNTITTSAKIKNLGVTPTRIYFGFAMYDKHGTNLIAKHFPYDIHDKTLTVVSSSDGSDKIIVNTYPKWAMNCHLALNAQDDFSDIPSTVFVNGNIKDVKCLENGQGEITMTQPLKTALPIGSKIRINGPYSGHNYLESLILPPNEEAVINTKIHHDTDFYQFSPQAISRGVYYVKPVLFSYSTNPEEENTILISDYTISF